MVKLITGGTGYIAAELAHILTGRGEEVVLFDNNIHDYRIEDIKDKVRIVRGDLGNFAEVFNVVKEYKITEIYHMGAMLTYMSELNPWASFQSNVVGSYNVLEAARLLDVEKMMFTSTLGTYGSLQDEILTDLSLQRPLTVYGCGKLYIEGLGRFYSNKFGLDFRSIRYATMIGPNVRTPMHWAPAMIEDAILGNINECIYGTPETRISMIYVRDAARAADMILAAPRGNIKMMNYNVAGIPTVISADELERFLKNRYPQSKVIYNLDPELKKLQGRHASMQVFDDSYARNEWNWAPQYTTLVEIVDIFEKDITENPIRYGLT
jgi:nucleoside-diphosphate-sugar epimerase